MTPTHTMRLPVRAWQVGEDGSLPDESGVNLARYGAVRILADPPYWYLYTRRLWPGDWFIVRQDVSGLYPAESMTDAEFRERCEEV